MEKESEKNPESSSGLIIPQKDAEERIGAQIKKGFDLLAGDIYSLADLEAARQGKRRWDQYNIELLKRIDANEQYLNEYYQPVAYRSAGATSFGGQKEQFLADVSDCINKLSSI
ncbi:MAG: hypothetical protein V3R33_04605 [Anaerolineales bacterium]